MLSYLLFVTCTDHRVLNKADYHTGWYFIDLGSMFPSGKGWGEKGCFLSVNNDFKSVESKNGILSWGWGDGLLSSSWITQDAFLNSFPHPQGSHREGQNARRGNTMERGVLSQLQVEISSRDVSWGFECCVVLLPFSLHQDCRHCPSWLLREPSVGRTSRWWRSKMRRLPSSPQIHQKYIYMWNSSYRTPTECWQKTSDLPKGKKLPTYLGRAKEKTETKE